MNHLPYRADRSQDQQAKAARQSIGRRKQSDPRSRQSCQWSIWLPATNADVVEWSIVTASVLVAAYLAAAVFWF